MGDEKFMAMAGEMLDDEDCPVRVAPWASVLGARVWLAGHLEDVAHRVDAEATERAARVCDAQARELREIQHDVGTDTDYWATRAAEAEAYAAAIRTTPAAREGEEN